MNRDEVLAILGAFKRDCGEQFGILELGLFGSVARGAAGDQSDVDVCVKTRTPDPFVLVHIKEGIEQRLGRHVDIVRLRERMSSFLKARIEEEGIYVGSRTTISTSTPNRYCGSAPTRSRLCRLRLRG